MDRLLTTERFLTSKLISRRMKTRNSVQLIHPRRSRRQLRRRLRLSIFITREPRLRLKRMTTELLRKRRRMKRPKKRLRKLPPPRKIELITHNQSHQRRLNHQRLRLHQPHQLQQIFLQSLLALLLLDLTFPQSLPVLLPREDTTRPSSNKELMRANLTRIHPTASLMTNEHAPKLSVK